jgi:hypothetical protein
MVREDARSLGNAMRAIPTVGSYAGFARGTGSGLRRVAAKVHERRVTCVWCYARVGCVLQIWHYMCLWVWVRCRVELMWVWQAR